MPPAASWQSEMIMYYLSRKNDHMSLMGAWTKVRMTPANARTALDPASGLERGLIPPEIFSHVLARSRATTINPNDDVADVIIENPPSSASLKLKAPGAATRPRKAAKTKAAKRKAPRRKSAKAPKRTSTRRKPATRRSGQRGRKK
jgi:hypothetical protein